MKFGKVKILTLALLLAGLAIAVAAGFMTKEGSPEYTWSLVLVCLLFASGLAVSLIWARCPHCGKRLFVNFLRLSRCPRCGKELDSEGRYRPAGKGGGKSG